MCVHLSVVYVSEHEYVLHVSMSERVCEHVCVRECECMLNLYIQ